MKRRNSAGRSARGNLPWLASSPLRAGARVLWVVTIVPSLPLAVKWAMLCLVTISSHLQLSLPFSRCFAGRLPVHSVRHRSAQLHLEAYAERPVRPIPMVLTQAVWNTREDWTAKASGNNSGPDTAVLYHAQGQTVCRKSYRQHKGTQTVPGRSSAVTARGNGEWGS